MTAFVFLGPSLPVEDARKRLDAVYLPPVAMGDLYRLVETQARPGDLIGIVDGVFERVPAVWHKEILYALSRGVHVFGASSMGALRAAELHPFGMVGVGRIFEAYRDETLTDDDEVAVAHAPEEFGYRPLSHAMVSFRFALADMAQRGVISRPVRDALTQRLKDLHFSQRTWPALIQAAQALSLPEPTLTTLRSASATWDAKADDARLLLDNLAKKVASDSEAFICDFVLENTAFWSGLRQGEAGAIALERYRQGLAPSPGSGGLARQARAVSPDRPALLQKAALMLSAWEATQDWTPAVEDLQRAAVHLAHRHALTSDDALRAWRLDQALDGPAWRRLLDLEARLQRLIRRRMGSMDYMLEVAAQSMGLRGNLAELSARSTDVLARFGGKTPTLEEAGLEADALQAWYELRCGRLAPDPETHALELGFQSFRDLLDEIVAARLVEIDDEMQACNLGLQK